MRPDRVSHFLFATLAATLSAGTATYAQAQAHEPGGPATYGASTTSMDTEPAVPPLIEGCEAYGSSCTAGSGRLAQSFASGAYVDQVGTGNRATIAQRQGSAQTYARVSQTGERNTTSIDQDAASAFADIAQSGEDNFASVAQSGSAHSSVSLAQTGSGNAAAVTQMGGVIGHAASLRQTGSGNQIRLDQSGENNSAILEQSGDDNLMQVEQTGDNNALTWVQNGSGLSGPTVTMEGNGRAIGIYQSNPSGFQ